MSVTVLQTPDVTSEAFNAWRTIEEIKNKAKEIAINQALAQQHIQSSKTVDQLNQARLQVEQQQASEFVQPEAINRRKQALDTQLQQEQANVTGTSLRNEGQMMSNDFTAQANPLLLKHQLDSNRQARIAADTAQQGLNELVDLMPQKKELDKMTLLSEKYKLISQGGVDPSQADLLAQIKKVQTQGILEQLPTQIKYQQAALDSALNEMGQKPIIDRLKTFSAAAGALGVPGAKAAVSGLPGYENFQNVPNDAMSEKGNPKNTMFRMTLGLASQGDTDAQEALSELIAQGMGAKNPTGDEKMQEALMQKSGIQVPADTIRPIAKKLAEAMSRKFKSDPQGAMMLMEGGGQGGQFGTVPGMETTTQGKQNVGAVPQPAMTPTPSPATTIPPVSTQSGTQKIEGVNPTDKLDEMENVI